MKRSGRIGWGDERGGTLALVAVSMIVILAVAALAIDLAAAFSWRAEAQKIADSASLAGASAFLDEPDTADARPIANERAYEYALLHTIKKVPIDSSEVTVEVLPEEEKVRVYINKQDLPTWFARIIGVRSIDIGAVAAAQAFAAGESTCLKPIALPDLWFDDQDDGNYIWDEGENWDYNEDEGDTYQRWDPDQDAADISGYGPDNARGGDQGREVQLKAQDPQSEFNFDPGLFFPWRLPTDDDMATCDTGGGGGNDAGGAVYRQNICECNTSPIETDVEYPLEPGNMVGPTRQGFRELFDEETRNLVWRDDLGGPAYQDQDGTWTRVFESPRIFKVALMDPAEISGPGMETIKFNNFAKVFLETLGSGNQDPIRVKFMFFSDGSGSGSDGSNGATLVKFLQLVE